MRSLFAVIAAFALLYTGAAVAQSVGQFPFALTREGQMLGAVRGEVASFKGLAYAAPPVGSLRWRPPQALPESSEMSTAYDYGAPCLQPSLPAAREDCLTLNVFRPFGVDGPLPVMVFIHGGDFVTGTASDPLFDGSRFAQAGLIVVTLNYRLGVLGWLTHPALSDDSSGNFGLMDQVTALRWVHDNIAAFGGDANAVRPIPRSLPESHFAIGTRPCAPAVVAGRRGRKPAICCRVRAGDGSARRRTGASACC
jgi:para-nitrobenzyl esterase